MHETTLYYKLTLRFFTVYSAWGGFIHLCVLILMIRQQKHQKNIRLPCNCIKKRNDNTQKNQVTVV